MVIKILDCVPQCYTTGDGAIIGGIIRNALVDGNDVVVSFKGVGDVPSSFVNVAFARLLDHYSIDYIRTHLHVVDSNHQINDMIKHRLNFAAKEVAAA